LSDLLYFDTTAVIASVVFILSALNLLYFSRLPGKVPGY
jgi:hypothetical protein